MCGATGADAMSQPRRESDVNWCSCGGEESEDGCCTLGLRNEGSKIGSFGRVFVTVVRAERSGAAMGNLGDQIGRIRDDGIGEQFLRSTYVNPHFVNVTQIKNISSFPNAASVRYRFHHFE
jgi:hypothetical protein